MNIRTATAVAEFLNPYQKRFLYNYFKLECYSYEEESHMYSDVSNDDLIKLNKVDLLSYRINNDQNVDIKKYWFLLNKENKNRIKIEIQNKVNTLLENINNSGFKEISMALEPILNSECYYYPKIDAINQIKRVSVCKNCVENDQIDIALNIMNVIELPVYLKVEILKNCANIEFWNKVSTFKDFSEILKLYIEKNYFINLYKNYNNLYEILKIFNNCGTVPRNLRDSKNI